MPLFFYGKLNIYLVESLTKEKKYAVKHFPSNNFHVAPLLSRIWLRAIREELTSTLKFSYALLHRSLSGKGKWSSGRFGETPYYSIRRRVGFHSLLHWICYVSAALKFETGIIILAYAVKSGTGWDRKWTFVIFGYNGKYGLSFSAWKVMNYLEIVTR